MEGRTVAHYRILQKLGSGGMGDVYSAEDTRLHRAVALKFLPREVGADPHRLERFEREAQAVAALNHPNVVTLYGVEEDGDLHFLTMELVTGKTLAQIIPARGLPVPEFFSIAMPLCDAISAAHQAGIVHRDLKPANVMLSQEGRVKVLDFGLAKLNRSEPSSPDAETETARELTAPHHVLGTAPYMSPEQAMAQPADARSDIFSLGIVLYEMCTGVRPFRGSCPMSIISSILKDSPAAPAEINPALPHGLDRVILRCLVKDPTRRYQSATDLRNDLEELQTQGAPGERAASRKPRPRFVWIAAGALAVTAAAFTFWLSRRPAAIRPAVPHAAFAQITSQPGIEWFPSFSPDGKWLVYAAAGTGADRRHIYLQSVSGQTPFAITRDAEADDDQPAFSPDGERIAFRSSREGGGIFVMGRTGEAIRRVTRAGYNPSWSPDGTHLAFTMDNVELNPQNINIRSELWAVNVGTGVTRRICESDAVLASWSPHNHRIAFTRRAADSGQSRGIWTVPVAGGVPASVTSGGHRDWNPVWSPDGKYVYFSSDRGGSMNLWRVPIDERSGKALGDPTPVTTPAPYLAHPSVSADGGRIAYTSALFTINIQQLAMDASGGVQGEPAWVTTGSRRWSSPDPSPEGEWVAFYSLTQPEGDIYIARPDGSGLRQLTGDSAIDRMPRWSPDGKWIAFFSNRSGIHEVWKIRTDGSEMQQLTEGGGSYLAWSPDGSRMASSHQSRVCIFDPNRPWKQQTPEMLPPTDASSTRFLVNSWSPDGERLAGEVQGQGIAVYTLRSRTYDRLADFGEWPVWLPDSRRVLFVAHGTAFYIADTRSRHVRKVYSARRDILGPPRLTRDGKTACYSRRVTESDIWLATLR
ncbi:MAG: protein kinase [Bryobacteraceae bacterium]